MKTSNITAGNAHRNRQYRNTNEQMTFDFLFFIFLEKRFGHFMQIVSFRDNLNEMSKPVFFWKVKRSIINPLSVGLAQRIVKVKLVSPGESALLGGGRFGGNFILYTTYNSLILVRLKSTNPSLAEHDMPCLSKQCRSRSLGFWRSQLIWICTVCH